MHAAEFFLHLFPVSTQKQRRLKLKLRQKVDKVFFNSKSFKRIKEYLRRLFSPFAAAKTVQTSH